MGLSTVNLHLGFTDLSRITDSAVRNWGAV